MKKLFVSLLATALLLLPAIAFSAEVPPTIPHPGINGENGYRIGLTNLDTRVLLWQAPYLYETPYIPNSGWLAGDRVAYGCAYGFLQHNGEIIGRFTFRAIPDAASYMRVNDTYMEEGVRYYDGSPTPPGTVQVPALECPAVSESYAPSTADERPKVVFWHGDEAVEIRDYLSVVAAPGVTFDLVSEIREPFTVTSSTSGTHTVNSRVTVVAMDNGIPVIVVYYDALGEGSMFPTDVPPTGPECNAIISMSQGAQVYSGSQAGAADANESELEALTGDEWMLLFKSGKVLRQWTDPAMWNTLGVRSRCGTDAEIDNVLFIFDPKLSSFTSDLNKVIDIMESRYPNADISVSLLVGSVGHVTCTVGGRTVAAAQTHASNIAKMTMPEAGPDLDVPCSGYADRIGHLNNSGATSAQSQVAGYYNGS